MNSKRKVELLPQVEPLVPEAIPVYLVIVDLCGSTEFKERCRAQGIPDWMWFWRQKVFLERTSGILREHGATVVKTNGDSVLAYYGRGARPQQILISTQSVLRAFDGIRLYSAEWQIESKVSIDFGPTFNGSIQDSRIYDPIGSSVDRCARLCALASANEIVFSSEFRSKLAAEVGEAQLRIYIKAIRRTQELKGFGKTTFFAFKSKRRKPI